MGQFEDMKSGLEGKYSFKPLIQKKIEFKSDSERILDELKEMNTSNKKENKKAFTLTTVAFLFAGLAVILPLLQPLIGKCTDIVLACVLSGVLIATFLYIKYKD